MFKNSQVQANQVLLPLFTDLNCILLQCTCPDTWKIQKEIPVSTEEIGTTDAGDGGEAFSTGEMFYIRKLWSQTPVLKYIQFLDINVLISDENSETKN
jgi:hypothetical protein